MSDHKDVLRGRDAKLVLDNPAFKEAMETLRKAVIDQWRECPVRDKEGQILLLQLAKLTDKFEGLLIGVIESGKMAQRKIDLDIARDESAAKRFARKVVSG